MGLAEPLPIGFDYGYSQNMATFTDADGGKMYPDKIIEIIEYTQLDGVKIYGVDTRIFYIRKIWWNDFRLKLMFKNLWIHKHFTVANVYMIATVIGIIWGASFTYFTFKTTEENKLLKQSLTSARDSLHTLRSISPPQKITKDSSHAKSDNKQGVIKPR